MLLELRQLRFRYHVDTQQ
ncbi:hypothetical protein D018_2142A, partial [Vibrio parahaemolyticus VP2007-007]